MISTATINLSEILTEARLSDEPLVFYGVSWDDYQEMLDEIGEQRYPRLTYYNGFLKFENKTNLLRENISRFLLDLITITSLILRRKTIPVGAMSLISKQLNKGVDPDESFYIQNADRFPNKKTLFDYNADTPPDLVIEIDESSKSTEKFAIYADFKIKEFWRYDKNELKIYELDGFGNYLEVIRSVAFPILSVELLNEFMVRREESDQFEALLDFENRLREQLENN